MSAEHTTGSKVQTTQTIRKNAHYFEPFLDFPQEFTVWDTELDNYEYQQRVEKLKSCGAVIDLGYQKQRNESGSWNRVKEYRLTNHARKTLELALDTETFECGHRIHVHHKDGGGFGCKYCDEERSYSRETVEDAL